ncbi:hypothetical protein SFC07_05325 [Corynebacterium callunae]|uniref:hypothetical protein n=1 Tax=Corynebacterium callunae TaxID=1721 RepID=UPI003982C620
MKNTRLMAAISVLLTAMGLVSPSAANAAELVGEVPERTQIAIVLADGTIEATDNADESRPALSLAKLYLGFYVLDQGDEEDAALVYDMIRYSQDATADYLEGIYPEAIPEVIEDFELDDTVWDGYWGNSTTSAIDIAEFVSKISADPIAEPLIDGMEHTAEVATDGYDQDFGTYTLPDVIGTKFGWSDNRDVHASVSIGTDFVVAANTYGDAETLTEDVQESISEQEPEIPEVITLSKEAAVVTVQPTRMKTAGEVPGSVLALLPDSAPIPNFIYRLLVN